jgi:hypothetical protein
MTLFLTDKEALGEVLKAIEEDGIGTLIGRESGEIH